MELWTLRLLVFFFSYSTDTKEEADDDNDKCRYQKYVIVFEDKERTNACQYQQENYDEILHLCLLLSGNAFPGIRFGG